MANLIIIGAGGHAKVAYEIAKKLNMYESISFYDDYKVGLVVDDKGVCGKVKDVNTLMQTNEIFVAIGNNQLRTNVYRDFVALKAKFATLIEPSAIISESADIGDNCVIMANCVVNSSSIIKNNCIINTAATIDHDCCINENTHISVGSHLAGSVMVGRNVMVGIGSCIINNINICDDVLIGGGSVVVKDIKISGTYVGVPCKMLA